MLIDFNFPIVILGKNLAELSDNEKVETKNVIINSLRNHDFKEGDDMKRLSLSEDIYENDTIDIDKADFSLIKRAVEKNNGLDRFIKARIKEYFEDIKFGDEKSKDTKPKNV